MSADTCWPPTVTLMDTASSAALARAALMQPAGTSSREPRRCPRQRVQITGTLIRLAVTGHARRASIGRRSPFCRSAFYFTVTVLSTVGFGDIAADSDLVRLVVTVQTPLDLTLLAVVVRVFLSAAKT
jgi:Ion channel